MNVDINHTAGSLPGVLADFYYTDRDNGSIEALEAEAFADMTEDYPDHRLSVSYFGKNDKGLHIRVLENA